MKPITIAEAVSLVDTVLRNWDFGATRINVREIIYPEGYRVIAFLCIKNQWLSIEISPSEFNDLTPKGVCDLVIGRARKAMNDAGMEE